MSEENSGGFGDILQNMDKIKAFSNMMGGGGSDMPDFNPGDIMKAMEMANKMKGIMSMFNDEEKDDTPEIEMAKSDDILSPTREISVINAAIPFLDKEYQKNLFIAVKFLEMKKLSSMDTISIQSQSSVEGKRSDRRGAMLKAMRPYLSKDERKEVDQLMKFMKLKNMMSVMNKGEL